MEVMSRTSLPIDDFREWRTPCSEYVPITRVIIMLEVYSLRHKNKLRLKREFSPSAKLWNIKKLSKKMARTNL